MGVGLKGDRRSDLPSNLAGRRGHGDPAGRNAQGEPFYRLPLTPHWAHLTRSSTRMTTPRTSARVEMVKV